MGKAVLKVFFGVLVFHHIIAAPSEVKLEVEVPMAEETTEVNSTTLLDESPEESTTPQSQRQKRWYNYYGLPPINPSFFNRDDSFTSGVLGPEDPLLVIHRRLQDITNSLRQPVPPQFPSGYPPFPALIPVIYVPQVGCGCTPNNNQRPSQPTDTTNKRNETDKPGVANRWPEMEDERQNWGIVTNNNGQDEDDGDGSRPISLEPIQPDRPVRPAPPVEHGSIEGTPNTDNSAGTTTTTQRPPQAAGSPGLQPPSNCDSAILRCCHLPQVTIDCFAYQGCPDPSSYGNPCDSGVISRVLDRFLRFYGQRNG